MALVPRTAFAIDGGKAGEMGKGQGPLGAGVIGEIEPFFRGVQFGEMLKQEKLSSFDL